MTDIYCTVFTQMFLVTIRVMRDDFVLKEEQMIAGWSTSSVTRSTHSLHQHQLKSISVTLNKSSNICTSDTMNLTLELAV